MHLEIIVLLLPLSTCIPQNGEWPERLKSTCHTTTVTEGKIARLEFPISKAIAGDPNLYIFIRNPDLSGDILECGLNITTLKVECSVLKDQFKHELTGDTLSLIIPNATRDVKGRYELHAVHNGAADPPISCQLVVRNVPAGKPKNNRDGFNVTHLIAIACVVIGVTVPLILACVFMWKYSLRKLQQPFEYVLLTASTGQSGLSGKHNKSEKKTKNMSWISTKANMSKTSNSNSCAMKDEDSREPVLGNNSEHGNAENAPGGITTYDEQHAATNAEDRHVPPKPGHRSPTPSVGNQDGYTTSGKTSLTEDQNQSQNQSGLTSPARETQYEEKSRGVGQPYNEQHAATHAEDRRSSCDPSKRKSATLADDPHGYTSLKSAAQNHFQDGSGANSSRRSSCDPSQRKSATLADDPHGYTPPKSAAQNHFQDGSGANSSRNGQYGSGKVASSKPPVDQHGNTTRIPSSQPAHQHHSHNQTSANYNRHVPPNPGPRSTTTSVGNQDGYTTTRKSSLTEDQNQSQKQSQNQSGPTRSAWRSSCDPSQRKSATLADDPHGYTPPKSAAQNHFQDGSGANSSRNGHYGFGRVPSSERPVDQNGNITGIPSCQPAHQHHSNNQTCASSNRNASFGAGKRSSATAADHRYDYTAGTNSLQTAMKYQYHKHSLV